MSVSFLYPAVLWLLVLIPLTVGLALLGQRARSAIQNQKSRIQNRFWVGLALRSVLLLLIVLALAGMQLNRRADLLTAVWLLDASDSLSPEEQARGELLIRQAVEGMPRTDRAAVVVFGQDALVERLASDERILPDLASVPVTTRTDIAGALQLALALFPDEGAKRLVLLSDGRQNLGDALEQAELAAAHGVELTYVPLGEPVGATLSGRPAVEVLLEALDAPADVRQGQGFDLTVVVHSTAAVDAALRVLGDGRLFHSQEVHLQPGTNRFQVPVEGAAAGFRRYRAQVVPDADTRLQNNEAGAFTVVHGPPRVLLVEGEPGEAEMLARALRAAKMEVVIVPPAQLPATLPELAAFDVTILANVPARALSPEAMAALPAYVRDLVRGLVMTGGQDTFGAGGYLRTPLAAALPVDMEVRSKDQTSNLALVLAVDKSGSMGRCHCDNPDLHQSYVRQEVGQPKVDIAKEAVMRAASALGSQDSLGVVAFDANAHWALEVQKLLDPAGIEGAIGGIQAVGQTNVRAGVEAAYQALQATEARQKHIILLTDGWSYSGDVSPLAREMADKGVTLSVVAAGGGSAEFLAGLAQSGGGRYYAAKDVLAVPDFFLKETVQAVGRYLVEEPFYPLPGAPSPVLRGLDPAGLPLLLGYNGTTLKATARQGLGTPQGDPLLATWQYGLGRAAVWTSDVKGQWAAEWLAWDSFPRFAAQLVGWTLPAPQVEGVTAEARLEDDRAVIRAEAINRAGLPRNLLEISATVVGPDLKTIRAPLTQVGAGRYEALLELGQPGSYLVQLGVHDGDEALGQQTLGLVVPYSPEYRASGTNRGLLGELARRTGGGELADPGAAFAHTLPIASRGQGIWASLLLAAALLFPLDVAVRRVMLGPQDARKAASWVRRWLRAWLPFRRTLAARPERALGRLFEARARARWRQTGAAGAPPLPPPGAAAYPEKPSAGPGSSAVGPGPPAASAQPPAAQPSQPTTDALTRLREAKARARRER